MARGAAAGSVYALLAALALILGDPGDDGLLGDGWRALLFVVLYIAAAAGTLGGLCGGAAGLAGGIVIWVLAELHLRRRALLICAAALGAALGWFCVDVLRPLNTAPDVDGVVGALLWRAGPAVFGAAAATWQSARTRRPAVG